MKLRQFPLKEKAQIVYDDIKNLEEEYLSLVDEGLHEEAVSLLNEAYPDLERRAIALLEEAGFKFRNAGGRFILLPNSSGVYGRVAQQLLIKEGYLLYLNFRSNIENSFQAHVSHSDRGISLPIEILLDPFRLNFSMYHELRHVFYEANRGASNNPLKSKVYILAPGRGELHFKNSRIVYNQGFSIEELLTFYNDRRLFETKLAKKKPEFLGLTHEERKSVLDEITVVHSELALYSLSFLRRVDEALVGIGDANLSLRFNAQNTVALVRKAEDGTRKTIAKLSLSEDYFGDITSNEGRKKLRDWVRAAIKEIEIMRENVAISLAH